MREDDLKKMSELTADDLLKKSLETLSERAKQRDVKQERSMLGAVHLFNRIHGVGELTEMQGWLFMISLKIQRAMLKCSEDDLVDLLSYTALAAECYARQEAERELSAKSKNPVENQKFTYV